MKLAKSLFICLVLFALGNATNRYEAEDAIVDINTVQKVADTKASGGFYVNTKDGNLLFNVNMSTAGFYAIWITYFQPFDPNGKIQNLTVNGVSKGQLSFPYADSFVSMKVFSKVKLAAGSNKIGITKSWGWVNIDFLEIKPYEDVPFSIGNTIVTPNPSNNARKLFSFLKQNFQKKIVSGVMTNTVFQNDGKYTPDTVENQEEVAWIIKACGKVPALIGLDFMHGSGKNSESQWHRGYNAATLSLAETVFKKGGIPAYCWHWKDPSKTVEAFYSKSSGNTPVVEFNLNRAYIDSNTCTEFNTNSDEYKFILADLDTVARYLKTLANKGIPILWRPLHESSGKWFWWGYSGPKATRGLYRLMFDRFTKVHGLNNLVWVWTTDEAGNAADWYPGDDCVDILGRDYYYYPREANHSSLVASFEKVKELYSAKKIVALSENGSIPHPDSLVGDGAGWSYFMTWYGDYTMDGWAHDNTAADWNSIMNNPYVITMDKMPGWDNIPSSIKEEKIAIKTPEMSIHAGPGFIECILTDAIEGSVEIYNLKGSHIATLHQAGVLNAGAYRFSVPKNVAKGLYIVRIGNPTKSYGSGITRSVYYSGK